MSVAAAERKPLYDVVENHVFLAITRADMKGRIPRRACVTAAKRFKPNDRTTNCPIANELYNLCCTNAVSTPVIKCPKFRPIPPPE